LAIVDIAYCYIIAILRKYISHADSQAGQKLGFNDVIVGA